MGGGIGLNLFHPALVSVSSTDGGLFRFGFARVTKIGQRPDAVCRTIEQRFFAAPHIVESFSHIKKLLSKLSAVLLYTVLFWKVG